jgi:FkbH-like protein
VTINLCAGTAGRARSTTTEPTPASRAVPAKPWKGVLWDLDGVVWTTRPAELDPDQVDLLLRHHPHPRYDPHDAQVWTDVLGLNTDVIAAMHRLNTLGMVQSCVSRNDPVVVRPFLQALEVWDYFRFAQIHDDADTSKSVWALEIVALLNLSPTAFVAIDDQAIERDDLHRNAGVTVADVSDIATVLNGPRIPDEATLTAEDRNRPYVYRAMENMHRDTATHRRQKVDRDQFLASTESEATLWQAGEGDLSRIAQLAVRTHQFNTTGIAYTMAELEEFRRSPEHLVLLASLTDKYVREQHLDGYGVIGVGLVSLHEHYDHLRLLLVSCTVETRKIGSLLLTEFTRRAHAAGKAELRGDFVDILNADGTSRNRKMYKAYRLDGFQRIPDDDPRLAETTLNLEDGRRLRVYGKDLTGLAVAPEYPAWLKVTVLS